MTAAVATFNQPIEESRSTFKTTFQAAASIALSAARKTVELAYDFFKANPIVTLVAADLLLTGGAFSQQFLVAGVQTIAGAAGDLGTIAASSMWDWIWPSSPELGYGASGSW